MSRDHDDDEQPTIPGVPALWLMPVDTAELLPEDDVVDGNICYVNSEKRSYIRENGGWVPKVKGS